MVSETFLGAYFWGVYIWFIVGAVLIGGPAILQIGRVLFKKGGK